MPGAALGAEGRRAGKKGCSFLKERTKEFLSVCSKSRAGSFGVAIRRVVRRTEKSLFASFSSEKEVLPCPMLLSMLHQNA
jgi:hypothetical protein